MVGDVSYLGNKRFLLEVLKGNVAGHSVMLKYGRNDNVPRGSWAFVTLLGLTSWPLSAPTPVRIKAGGDPADDGTGSGAREVVVQGIDDSFNEVREIVPTAGASASSVSDTVFWRVHRAWVSACGTYGGANAGAITVESLTGDVELIRIAADEGQTHFAAWTVPTGKTAYLLGLHMYVGNGKRASIRLYTREDIGVVSAPVKSKRVRLSFPSVGRGIAHHPHIPELTIKERSDIWFEAYGEGPPGGAEPIAVWCDFELLLVDN